MAKLNNKTIDEWTRRTKNSKWEWLTAGEVFFRRTEENERFAMTDMARNGNIITKDIGGYRHIKTGDPRASKPGRARE